MQLMTACLAIVISDGERARTRVGATIFEMGF